MNRSKLKQQGFTFGGFLTAAVILVIFSIMGLRLIPPYIENAKIKSVFNDIVHDPDMKNPTPQSIQASFDRRASVDDIQAIQSSDIDIETDGDHIQLSASYDVKVPLFANISFYLEFNPSSAGN